MAGRISKTPVKAATKAGGTPANARTGAAGKGGLHADPAPTLLSGGNPQIAKGQGDAPVQAYIAAMPGWKQAVGRRLDALIEANVAGVRKAVKWNSPFYGAPGDAGWFLSLHVFTQYIKITFFRGTSLRPPPPGASKTPQTRYLDVREGALDEALFVAWVRQASQLPGERL